MDNKLKYIANYNKNNYKMYQFRVKKEDESLINYLDNLESRNQYIVSLIENDINSDVYTIKQLKQIIKPILRKYDINEIYLFGSYSRGEATSKSDVDIYCEKGNIKTYFDQGRMEEEIRTALNKEIDIIFIGSHMNDYFYKQIMEDAIKI